VGAARSTRRQFTCVTALPEFALLAGLGSVIDSAGSIATVAFTVNVFAPDTEHVTFHERLIKAPVEGGLMGSVVF
jgi:hypothetical protein